MDCTNYPFWLWTYLAEDSNIKKYLLNLVLCSLLKESGLLELLFSMSYKIVKNTVCAVSISVYIAMTLPTKFRLFTTHKVSLFSVDLCVADKNNYLIWFKVDSCGVPRYFFALLILQIYFEKQYQKGKNIICI